MTAKLLILGGTTEGRRLAERLSADPRFEATLSLAGRTARPAPQALPTRIGGFGGVAGLSAYLRDERIDALIVATHPHAGTIAANAAEAARLASVPVVRWLRPGWTAVEGDRWIERATLEALADAIGPLARRVLVTTGRQGAAAFERAPQHRYWFRSVDPIDPPLDLPNAEFLLDRGPYDVEAEMALMRRLAIEILVAKNSGGTATHAKIEAARHLGVAVLLLARPAPADLATVETLDAVTAWLDHRFGPENRGA